MFRMSPFVNADNILGECVSQSNGDDLKYVLNDILIFNQYGFAYVGDGGCVS